MNTIVIRPSMLVTRATHMAADSIAAIDQQCEQVEAIRVDSSLLPSLGADLTRLNQAIAMWPQTIRDQVIQALSLATRLDESLERSWVVVPKDDQALLLSFARLLEQTVGRENDAVVRVNAAIAPFRAALDQAVGSLKGDFNDVTRQIVVEQQLAAALASRVIEEEDRVHDFEKHPWKLILSGLSLPVLIYELSQIIQASNDAQAALTQLNQVEAQIQQLAAGRGPLLSLSLAVVGFSGSISNIQTALSQITSQLAGIVDQAPQPAILAAQLGAVMEDLASSQAIASEVLTGV